MFTSNGFTRLLAKHRVKHIKHLTKRVFFWGQQIQALPSKAPKPELCRNTEWVFAVSKSLLGGQRPPAATMTCCPGWFAACQGLRSRHCGKVAVDYYPLLLFHTGNNDDGKASQESIKHWLHCHGVWWWGVGGCQGHGRRKAEGCEE